MPSLIDLVGKKFGKLTVIARADDRKRPCWLCRCECGTEKVIGGPELRTSHTKSCGCITKTRGGDSNTREYKIWQRMIDRCHRPDNHNYKYYGELGTYVCARWRNSFLEFFADMGKAPDAEHSLDRIDTLGSYTCGKCAECQEKKQTGNCRWASKDIQARNAKSNRKYTHDGKTMILKDWAKFSGIHYITLWHRLNRGVPFSEAITISLWNRKAITKSKQKVI